MRRLAILEFVVLTIGTFFWKLCFRVVPMNGSARMRYESHCKGAIDPLGLRCWAMMLSVGLYRLMKKYDVDPVIGLFALARANEIDIGVADEPVWFPFNFEDRIVCDPGAFEDPGHSIVMHLWDPVRYGDE